MNRTNILRTTPVLLMAFCIAYPCKNVFASGEFLHRSNTSIHTKCRYEQQRERNVYYQRYKRECTKEFEACRQNAEEKGIATAASSPCNEHIYQNATKIEGSCPKLLERIEAAPDESTEQTLAKVALRRYFHEIRDENGVRFVQFRKENSIKELRNVLSEQPENLYALYLLASNFTELAEEYEELTVRTKLLQHDHVCDTALNFGIEIVLRGYLHFFSSYTRAVNPKSKLQPGEMRSLTREVWDAITSTYLDLWEYGPPYRDLTLAYRISNPLVTIQDEKQVEVFYDLLGERRVRAYEGTIQKIRSEVLKLYSSDAGVSRAAQLNTICSDYAFEIGFVGECMQLIRHYSTEDKSMGVHLNTDLYEASLRSLLAVTRTCNALSTHSLKLGMRTVGFGTCLSSNKKLVTNAIKDTLLNYDETKKTWYSDILWSYIDLEDRAADHFSRALAVSLNSLSHVLLLSKRLVNRGNRDAAVAIVNESLKTVQKIPVEERLQYTYKVKNVLAHMTIVSEFQYSIRQESDLVSLLQKVLDQVKSGSPIEFHETQFQSDV